MEPKKSIYCSHVRTLVPKTIPGMALGTRVLKWAVDTHLVDSYDAAARPESYELWPLLLILYLLYSIISRAVSYGQHFCCTQRTWIRYKGPCRAHNSYRSPHIESLC